MLLAEGVPASSNPSRDSDELDEKVPFIEPVERDNDNIDVEAQKSERAQGHSPDRSSQASQQTPDARVASNGSKRFHLALYFLLNLSLTFFNKAVLNEFHYPWTLTVFHSGITGVASGCIALRDRSALATLSPGHHAVIFAYGILFTLNIAMSNISLDAVSVALHQTIRATCPVITIALSFLLFRTTYSTLTVLSTLPIMLGAAVTAASDYDYTAVGVVLTLAGVVLASIKTIVTNRLLVGPLAMPPLEFLLRMSPLAALQCAFCAYASGEVGALADVYRAGGLTRGTLLSLCANGTLACMLNISSMYTNRAVGALTMTTAANVKQCATIVLGTVLFGSRVSALNAAGIAMTLAGAAWYSRLELANKARK